MHRAPWLGQKDASTSTYTRVCTHTRVYMHTHLSTCCLALWFPLTSEALGREQVVLLLGGRMIYGDLYRHQGVGPMGGVTATLSISVNSPRNHMSPSLEGNCMGTVAASPDLLPGSV